jgi:heptosyltransferase-2
MRERERRAVRIAVIAPNWLGDAVMCLPALGALADAGARLSILCAPYTARVFMHQPGADDLWVDSPGGRGARVARRARALRRIGADVAAVFPPSFSSALPAALARTARRVGYRADARRVLLTHAPAMPPRDIHLTRAYHALALAALRAGGIEGAPGPKPARLHVAGTEREAVRARFGSILASGYVVVVPGAAFGPAKSWPEERYRALCGLLARDVQVVLAGSAADAQRCRRIARDLPGVHPAAGVTSLGELFALLEGARAVIANDSGAPHAAAALGVPVVVLFGSTAPAWTAPLGPRVRVLQHHVHCNPCFRRECPTQLECFHGIAVDEVLAAARELLAPPPS